MLDWRHCCKFSYLENRCKSTINIEDKFAYLPTVLASIHLAPTQDPKSETCIWCTDCWCNSCNYFGVFIKFLLPLFPPLVTGTVVFVIGLSLYPVGMKYMGGNGNVGFGWVKQVVNGKDMLVAKGVGSLQRGNWKYWLVAIITLVVVIFLTNFTTGITKIASILFAIIVGCIVSIPLGLVDFSSVAKASLVPKIATPLYFGLKFDPAIIVGFVILFIVNSVQAIGDLSATTAGGLDRLQPQKNYKGGLLGYGVTNAAALLGCPPLSTYSQNVGIVGTTKVVNRTVMGIAAVIIIIAGVFQLYQAYSYHTTSSNRWCYSFCIWINYYDWYKVYSKTKINFKKHGCCWFISCIRNGLFASCF